MRHDAIVLAGGTGRRLGGVLKPQVTVRGRRLLDHVLDATAQARRVVVVAPETVPVPDGVVRTLEDPPHGGPVAGIAAGLLQFTDDVSQRRLAGCKFFCEGFDSTFFNTHYGSFRLFTRCRV